MERKKLNSIVAAPTMPFICWLSLISMRLRSSYIGHFEADESAWHLQYTLLENVTDDAIA